MFLYAANFIITNLQKLAFSWIWEGWKHLFILSNSELQQKKRHAYYLQRFSIYVRAWWPDGELTFALSSSTMKWHKEALKKYSLALYFSRGLSMVLDPTCLQTQTGIPEWFSKCWWASNVVRICRRQTDGLPAHKSLLLSGTALTERCMKPPSADTCLQSCKWSKQTISKLKVTFKLY